MTQLTSTTTTTKHPTKRPAVPRLREASFDDYPQLVCLAQRYQFAFRQFDEWRHFWTDNPSLSRLPQQSKWPIGWVLERAGQIVGYVGNIPELYEFRGKELIAGISHAWIIAPEYRSFSTLLIDAYVRQKGAQLLIANTANPQASKALTAFGASPVPIGAWDRAGAWITNYRGFVEGWTRRRNWAAPKLLAYPISVALWGKDRLFHRRFPPQRTKIECCTAFDERFDRLWQRVRSDNPDRLLAVRSGEMLRWHFQYAKDENRLWITAINKRSEIVAYAIFLLKRPSQDGLKRMLLVDFQAQTADQLLFFPILNWALHRCRRERIHVLETSGLMVTGVTVASLAAYEVRQPSWGLMYKTADRGLAESLSDPRAWSPTLYDGDASL